MAAGEPLLRVAGLSVRFGGEAVVDHVDLEVARCEIVTLVGPNGSGKTTLLRAALGLHRAYAGRVWRAPGLRIGYVPQALKLDATMPMTVRRFVCATRRTARDAVDAALDSVGVAPLADSPMRALSGGETRRALLARALVHRPGLLVLDEPTAGVDVAGQADLYRLIGRIRDERDCGVLLVSHDLHVVMAATDRVVCMNHHVCCTGTPESITTEPAWRDLFGGELTPEIALYSHDHDHVHDLHGGVAGSAHER